MFGNLRISTKLLAMVGLSVFGVAAVAVVGLSALRSNLLEDRKIKLKELILVARQVIEQDRQFSLKAGLSPADAMERGKAILRGLRFGNDEYFYSFREDGSVQSHPTVEGKNLLDAKDPDGVFFVREQIAAAKKGGGYVSVRFPRAKGETPSPKINYAIEYKPYEWMIGGGVYVDDIDEIFWSQAVKIGFLSGVALLLLVAMGLVLRRGIVKPLAAMTAAMHNLAAGHTDTAIPALDRGDEVGAMAHSLQVFKNGMVETERLRGEQDQLKRDAEAEKTKLLNRMADDFEKGVRSSLDMLGRSATEMRDTSEGMSAAASEASKRTETVANVAGQATANVQTVAAATEELSSSVVEIGRQVTQSTEIAAQAVKEANRTNVTVQGLSAAAQKIGDVVKLISDIASQTNLLALNATIEAARAGEAGRGFAVVASEVKSLAGQTAKATEEISAQVAAMQNATNEAVHAIEGIGATIKAINEIATTIASAVEEQGAATREIARNVQQAAHGTGQVSQDIVGVNQATSETGASANRVLVSAEQLSQQSVQLRANVDSFIANIRAA